MSNILAIIRSKLGKGQLGLLQFKLFGFTIDISFNATFLGFNTSNDLRGINKTNFTRNVVFPPLSAGFGFDVKINPPSNCEKFVSPFIGLGRNLSIGTNVILDSDKNSIDVKGFNINLGLSIGVPIGVSIPQ